MTTLPSIAALIRAARCPECDGSGVVQSGGGTMYVTHDMAIDAGDRSLEGQVYHHQEPDVHQCQWCAERDDILKDIEAPHATAFSLIPEPGPYSHLS